MRGSGMIEVVRVVQRVREDERRVQLTEDIDRAVEHLGRMAQRIVAAVEELDLCAQDSGGLLGFCLPAGLHLGERDALLLPGELALAALTVGHAHDLHAVAALCVQRDGTARPPYEIAWVGGDDEAGFLGHAIGLQVFCVVWSE